MNKKQEIKNLFELHSFKEQICNDNGIEWFVKYGLKFTRQHKFGAFAIYRIYSTYDTNYNELNSALELRLVKAFPQQANSILHRLHQADNLREFNKIYKEMMYND